MGKQFNKRFNNKQRKPYQKNDSKKPFNKRNDKEGFLKKDKYNLNKWQSLGPRIPKVNLKENQVGITEYVNKGTGFMGILKSRFSDFQVNEIDLNGKVLQLNDLTVPRQKEEEMTNAEFNSAVEGVKGVITEDIWKNIKDLSETKLDDNKSPVDTAVYVEVSELDKEKRTLIHKAIKKLYEGILVSSTVGGDQLAKEADKKFIRVMKAKGRERNRWTFPEEYVHFLVHKSNMDTSEVAAEMARKLNLRTSQVNYCGTKDKRAKTTQKFCIRKRTPVQIAGSVKFMSAVKIGNFEFSKHVLKLGDLKGNRFRIALRNLSGEREHIETSLQNIKENGFINYFGLQRFGNCSTIPTYEIGVALIRADYKLACELILKPRENDLPFLKVIRDIWWKDRDSKAASAQFRSDRFIEKKLFDGLAQYGEHDYAAALRKIPRNMLLLYPHAFQSLIFNKMASRRIKEFGLKLIPGDLVYRNKDDIDVEFELTEIPENVEIEEETMKENATASTPTADSTESLFKRKVKPLTEEDIASDDYSIYDVVLPLPGHDITYPSNEMSCWYEEMLGIYDLSSEKLKHNVKTFAMAGAYRKLLVKPMDMSWEFRSYATPEETLILSDWEIHQGRTINDFKVKDQECKYEALLLDFGLPSAVYATMMLRELLKCDTSAAAQSSLQQSAMKENTGEEVISEPPKIEVLETETDNSETISVNDENIQTSTAEKRKAAAQSSLQQSVIKENTGEEVISEPPKIEVEETETDNSETISVNDENMQTSTAEKRKAAAQSSLQQSAMKENTGEEVISEPPKIEEEKTETDSSGTISVNDENIQTSTAEKRKANTEVDNDVQPTKISKDIEDPKTEK